MADFYFFYSKCSKHHIMICPDFIQYNNCHSSKCHLPHIRLQSVDRKKREGKKGAQTRESLVRDSSIHPVESLDFIPLSSHSPVPSPSSISDDSNDCDLSILPRFLAKMIQGDDTDDDHYDGNE